MVETKEKEGIQISFRPVRENVSLGEIDESKVMAPTKGFVASVGKLGVLTPVILQRNGDAKFHIIAGRRRVSAAIASGQETIDALIVDELSAEQGALIALTENMQRNPNPLVEARLMKVLVSGGRNQKDIAEELNVSQPQVAQRLKLLNLCEEVQTRVEEGEITISVARKMAGFTPEQQRELLDLSDSEDRKLTEKDVNTLKREGKLENVVPELPTPVSPVDLARGSIEGIREKVDDLDKKAKAELRQLIGDLYKALGGKLPVAKKAAPKKTAPAKKTKAKAK